MLNRETVKAGDTVYFWSLATGFVKTAVAEVLADGMAVKLENGCSATTNFAASTYDEAVAQAASFFQDEIERCDSNVAWEAEKAEQLADEIVACHERSEQAARDAARYRNLLARLPVAVAVLEAQVEANRHG